MSAGRPLEFDPDVALEAAMQLFWRRGFEATSLRDLLVATGLSKSSLYQVFGSKRELFERAVERYRQTMVRDMERLLCKAASGRSFLEGLLRGVARDTRGKSARRGCLVMNTASEFAQSDPVIAKLVQQCTKSYEDVLQVAIEQAQVEGEIPATKDPRLLAALVLTHLTGLRTMAKAGASASKVTAIANAALATLD